MTEMKMCGRLLLFDIVDNIRKKFPKNCKISYPESIPVAHEFHFLNPENVYGSAKVSTDDKGLICEVTLTNLNISDEMLSILENALPIGGFYKDIKTHWDNGVEIIDEARLVGIGITFGPAYDEYKMTLVKESED